MRLQDKPGWCSVASVQNALRCLGIKRPQGSIAVGMDLSEPSNEGEIVRALMAESAAVDVFHVESSQIAHDWLHHHVSTRGPVILAVDAEGHWVTVIGKCGVSFVVFDPSNVTEAKTENGVRVYSWRSLRTRWRSAVGFYGIGVSR